MITVGTTVVSGAPINGGGGGMVDPLTTEGDIIIADAAGAPIRLPVGATGYFLRSAAGRPAWREYSAAGLTADRPAAAAVREGMVYWATDAAAGLEGSQCVHQGGATYAWVTLSYGTPSDIVNDGLDAIVGAAPAGYTVVSDGAGGTTGREVPTAASLGLGAVIATGADAAAARAAIGFPALSTALYVLRMNAAGDAMEFAAAGDTMTIDRSWNRPAPTAVAVGTRFMSQDDLSVQISMGIAAAAGVAASGWVQDLPTGVYSDRAGLTPGQIYASSLNLAAYTIGNVTLGALFYYAGGITTGVFALIGAIGDSAASSRGISIFLKGTGANIDLVAFTGSGSVMATIKTSWNPSVGLHAVSVAAVAGNVWRFSVDGAAVVDVAMGVTYVAPSTTDNIAFVGRSGGTSPMLGQGVDMMVWNSLLSSADMALLTTLPGTPTYALPESASTGAAQIRVQASRFDPSFATVLRARGLPSGGSMTCSGVTRVGY